MLLRPLVKHSPGILPHHRGFPWLLCLGGSFKIQFGPQMLLETPKKGQIPQTELVAFFPWVQLISSSLTPNSENFKNGTLSKPGVLQSLTAPESSWTPPGTLLRIFITLILFLCFLLFSAFIPLSTTLFSLYSSLSSLSFSLALTTIGTLQF